VFFIILNYFYSNIKAGCDFRQFKIALRNNKMSTRDDNISNAKRWRTIIFHLSLQILYKYVVFNIKSLSSMSSAALWSNLCILYWIMFRFSLPNFPNVLIDFLCVLEIVVVLGFMNSCWIYFSFNCGYWYLLSNQFRSSHGTRPFTSHK
jgi:hypothetical protein